MGSRILRSLPLVVKRTWRSGALTGNVTTDLFSRPHGDGYKIAQEAASNGLNVGVDEYPTLESFARHVNKCKAFGLWTTTDASHGSDCGPMPDAKGLYTIGPCSLARGSPTVVAEIRVFLSRDLHGGDGEILQSVIPIAEQMVGDIGEHYHSCVIQVAALCPAWIEQIRKLGYIITACIPRAIDVAGEGLTSNFIFYKKLKELAVGPEPVGNGVKQVSRNLYTANCIYVYMFFPLDLIRPIDLHLARAA